MKPTALKPSPDAEPHGCEFLLYDMGQPRRCNESATWQRNSGFRYCSNHADQVTTALKRRGRVMHLSPYKP